MAGLESTALVTTGGYRWSRNPRLTGWGTVLVDAAILGRSGSALGLAALFWVAAIVYLPIEECFLAERYGDEYRRYRLSTPRLFGVSGDPRQMFNALADPWG